MPSVREYEYDDDSGESDDLEADSLEAVEELEDADAFADSPGEAVEEGRPYEPPRSAPVVGDEGDGARVTDEGLDDDDLEVRVLEALERNPGTNALDIEVYVLDGVATLEGTAATAADAEEALATALAVEGIVRVRSRIDVGAD